MGSALIINRFYITQKYVHGLSVNIFTQKSDRN